MLHRYFFCSHSPLHLHTIHPPTAAAAGSFLSMEIASGYIVIKRNERGKEEKLSLVVGEKLQKEREREIEKMNVKKFRSLPLSTDARLFATPLA